MVTKSQPTIYSKDLKMALMRTNLKSRPILFSGVMINANRAGIKDQTRRTSGLNKVNERPDQWKYFGTIGHTTPGRVFHQFINSKTDEFLNIACPYGEPGWLLWSRENLWRPKEFPTPKELRDGADTWEIHFDADGVSEDDIEDYKEWGWKHVPSIHTYQKESRFLYEVTEIRLERLNDISEEDAMREGILKLKASGRFVISKGAI